MNMAMGEINGAGGIAGRPLELVYQDTQSDPKQSVPVAQKFVDDERIVAELGDFSSAASMAASPIYERGKLIQFGLTNSDPKFTKGGEYMWSTAPTMQMDAALMADIAYKRLGKKAAVFYQASDWGDTSQRVFVERYKAIGGNVVSLENYLLTDKDMHSILSKARRADPDVLVLFSYYTDGALLLLQAKDVGLKGNIMAATSCYSNKFLDLGGKAVDGTVMSVLFFPRTRARRCSASSRTTGSSTTSCPTSTRRAPTMRSGSSPGVPSRAGRRARASAKPSWCRQDPEPALRLLQVQRGTPRRPLRRGTDHGEE